MVGRRAAGASPEFAHVCINGRVPILATRLHIKTYQYANKKSRKQKHEKIITNNEKARCQKDRTSKQARIERKEEMMEGRKQKHRKQDRTKQERRQQIVTKERRRIQRPKYWKRNNQGEQNVQQNIQTA